jgi:hypothetical protein
MTGKKQTFFSVKKTLTGNPHRGRSNNVKTIGVKNHKIISASKTLDRPPARLAGRYGASQIRGFLMRRLRGETLCQV